MPIEPVIALSPVADAVVLPRVLKRTLSSQLARLAEADRLAIRDHAGHIRLQCQSQ